ERSDYTCRAFRAGAWSVQPEAEVLRAMNEAGIWRDASVLPGLETDNGLTRFDFTRAPEHLPCWKVKDRVDAPDETGRIIEMPVYTQKIAFWRRALFKMVKTVRPFGRNYPGCAGAPAIGHPERASIKKWRLYLKETRPIIEKFDFCRASAMKMKYFMKSARKKYKALPGKKEPTPIIAVGHPKGFANENEFGRFMRWVQERDFVELDRLSEPSPWWRSPDGMNGRGQ
ncbi:MAG: hypothetical protein GY859_42220, partial [Desulfobacterales bacterium]|nr:hypothetical protein [Desulfobacterales bacterium]